MSGQVIRLGILRLTDSAPALVAEQRGLFAAQNLDVRIDIEPSWANIIDKLTWGLLDAAIMLPPLALAACLGLRGKPADLIVPMGLTLGGNSIVVNAQAAQAVGDARDPLEIGGRLIAWARAQPTPPRFAVVHAFSTHNLLLRAWLAECGGDPDRDFETIVVPPAQVVQALADGAVAGFCAGAPWGAVAARAGTGRVLLGTSAIRPHHPEKCLCVRAAWAAAEPAALAGLMRGFLQAGQICNRSEEADLVAATLAALDLEAADCRTNLPGGGATEHIQFSGAQAWMPDPDDALWFLGEMRRWAWIEPDTDLLRVVNIYRPDLAHAAAEAEGLLVI